MKWAFFFLLLCWSGVLAVGATPHGSKNRKKHVGPRTEPLPTPLTIQVSSGDSDGDGTRVPRTQLAKDPKLIFKYAEWRQFTGTKVDIADECHDGPYSRNPEKSVDVPFYAHAIPLTNCNAMKYRGSDRTFGNGFIMLQYYWLFGY